MNKRGADYCGHGGVPVEDPVGGLAGLGLPSGTNRFGGVPRLRTVNDAFGAVAERTELTRCQNRRDDEITETSKTVSSEHRIG